MLPLELQETLVIPPQARIARRASSVSQVLLAIREDLERGGACLDVLLDDGSDREFQIGVANTRASRERAYKLAREVYLHKDYVGEGHPLATAYDRLPDTLTLLAEDCHEIAAATVSLVYGGQRLPCDEIFGEEMRALRASGRRPVEVTRLAILEHYHHSKLLLVRLFNWIYIHARRVMGCDDFVIEVNPRHAGFYARAFGFEVLGPARPCPRVQGAPAVLLRLDLAFPEREMRRVAAHGRQGQERSLYSYFYTWLEEGAVAELLARQHKPMPPEDATYFGL